MQKRRRKIQINNKIKLTNAVRMVIIILSIVIIALGSGGLLKLFTTRTKITMDNRELYHYTNSFNSKADINMKKNEYINKEEMADDQVYISDLISNIDMNLEYKYTGSQNSEIKYNYKIDTLVKATYNDVDNTYDVLDKSETIKESEEEVVNSDDLIINEKINVDYEKYHKTIKEFKQSLGMNVQASLLIRLTVNTKTNIEQKDIENQYVSYYKISLGDKIALIDQKENDEETKTIDDEIQKKEKINIRINELVLNSFIIVLGIFILRTILVKTEELKTIKNEFKLELNRIMRAYEDKIVEIQDLKNIDIEHSTKVKDITQLVKLSEEALAPIYCYVKEEKEEAYFIVTKYNNSYIYFLK